MKHFWLTTSRTLGKPFYFLFLFSLISFAACKENEDVLGLNLRPDGGVIEGSIKKDFNIITRTVDEVNIQTDSLTTNILGAMIDPIFGLSQASVYTQFSLPEINIDFGTSPKLDSSIMSLVFHIDIPYYGNLDDELKLKFYRLDEKLYADTSYKNNREIALGDELGSWQGKVSLEDTTRWTEDGKGRWQIGMLRIKMDEILGDLLINADPTVYGSNTAFEDFFNGIAIVAETDHLGGGQGVILPIFLAHSNTKLTLYYNDTLSKNFLIDRAAERIGTYQTTNWGPMITDQFGQSGHFEETYVQSMAGLKTKIEIPDLYDLVADGNKILINEAELTLSVKDGTAEENYPAPARLLLVQPSDNDSTNAFIQDLIDEIAPPFSRWLGNYGGDLDEDNMTYTFRFNRHLQDLLDTYLETGVKEDKGFYVIIPSDNPITPSRLILDNSQENGENKIQLKVTYTKL